MYAAPTGRGNAEPAYPAIKITAIAPIFPSCDNNLRPHWSGNGRVMRSSARDEFVGSGQRSLSPE
jgi:hypothetical protein